VAWATGHGGAGRSVPVGTRIGSADGAAATLGEFFRLCDAAGADRVFSGGASRRYAALGAQLRAEPATVTDPDTGETFTITYDDHFDPATRCQGAVAASRLLPNSRLLTYAGWGHGACFIAGNSCVDDAVTRYLLTSRVPAGALTVRPGPGGGAGHDRRRLRTEFRGGAGGRTPGVQDFGGWVNRMELPNGSRRPQSVPYGRSVGSSVKSTPRSRSES